MEKADEIYKGLSDTVFGKEELQKRSKDKDRKGKQKDITHNQGTEIKKDILYQSSDISECIGRKVLFFLVKGKKGESKVT